MQFKYTSGRSQGRALPVRQPIGLGRRDYQGLLAAKAKYLCSEAALEATRIEVQIIGGLSPHKNMPLERASRDVQTSTLMPPDADVMLTNIGKGNLGLLGELFRVDDSMKL